jgi:hypothetical protein
MDADRERWEAVAGELQPPPKEYEPPVVEDIPTEGPAVTAAGTQGLDAA